MYRSIYGNILGTNESQLLFRGRPVGAMPQALGRGRTFYVDSNVGASEGTSPETAVGTIVAATALCAANRGDTVIVMPNHTENVAAATALSAVAGIRIIGLGAGASRPKVTFTTANTATYSLAVDNVYIENILFVANFLSIAAAITLTTAKDVWIANCEFRDTSGILDFLNIVKSTGAANTVDGLTIVDSRWFGLGTTSVNSFVLTANDIDRLCLLRNYVNLARTATAAALVTVTAGVLTNLECRDNRTITKATSTTGGSLISVGGTTSSGLVKDNFSQTLTTTSDLLFTTTVGLAADGNRVSGVIGAQGFTIPAADS